MISISVVSCQTEFMHRLKPLIFHLATYVLAQVWHKPAGFLEWETSARGEKHDVTMKRMCRTAPPAHTSAVQGLGPHLKQALLTKGCTDTAKESPERSSWKQPASACQTFCMTTTCSLLDPLPITSAQPLNGDLGSQASSLPCCSLLLMPQSTVWVLPSDFHTSSTAGRVAVILGVVTRFQVGRSRKQHLLLLRLEDWWICLHTSSQGRWSGRYDWKIY